MTKKKILVVYAIIGLIWTTQARADSIYSCKAISEATIKRDAAYGNAIADDSEYSRSVMAQKASEIFQFSKNKIVFDDKEFGFLGRSGSSLIYSDSYWGLVEVYGKGSSEATLFLTRSNGNGGQKTNYLKAEMWFCNR